MPPRTRTRATKVLKENIDVVKKIKVKSDGKISKPPRKALADKTNSLSDDNASIDIPIKTSKKLLKNKNTQSSADDKIPVTSKTEASSKKTPVKKSTSKSQDVNTKYSQAKEATEKAKNAVSKSNKKAADKQIPSTILSKDDKTLSVTHPRRNLPKQAEVEKSLSKDSLNEISPFKTPSKELESSLIANRPKRIHRLPSRFDEYSISPNKFIPVQPCYASTPLLQKNTKAANCNAQKSNEQSNEKRNKPVSKNILKSKATKEPIRPNSSNGFIDKHSPDTNNNGKNKVVSKVVRPKRTTVKVISQTKQTNSVTKKITPFTKRLLDKSLSFKVLEDNKSNRKEDVYEFTFDPNEEPTPQKKKRKRPVKKKPPQPKKTVVLKSNYNDNVSKALASLKSKVKPSQTKPVQSDVKPSQNHVKITNDHVKTNANHVTTTEQHVRSLQTHARPIKTTENVQSATTIAKPVTKNNIPQSNNYSANITPAMPTVNDSMASIHLSNYPSIRVEDIAADFELSDQQDDINYSPVNSPQQPPLEIPETHEETNPPITNDPLNLQEGVSFFEEPPVASSSMNVSVRHPLASPWRVEFGALPMRWHNNTYVKPNMTPAVESSFVNSELSTKKKHVYTNMLPEEPLPEIFENPASALKQTSIISFIKEVADRKANKKKRRRSPSPTKTNSIFEDINTTSDFGHKTPKKAKIVKETTPNVSSNNTSMDKENSNHSSNKLSSPTKGQKKKDKDCTYFGFDDSENLEQENVSPVKIIPNTRTRGLRSRNVLKELNTQPVPTRAALPVNPKAKLTSSEVVEQLYNQLKSAEDAQFPEKEIAKEPDNTVADNIDDSSWREDDEDSQSVHLFEDLEVVHHLKPHRKSYGKARKATFQQTADSDSDGPPVTAGLDRSSDDDMSDLTFHVPNVKQKKPAKKKKAKKLLTKKEEKEVEEWAAGFNSMCEDVDEFPLLVE